MSTPGAAVLVAALVLAAVAAWWLRERDGAIRAARPATQGTATRGAVTERTGAEGTGAEGTGADEPAPEIDVLRGLGVRPADAEFTVVQFSTAFCAPCRATRARLEQLQAAHPGLAVVHVDAEANLDAVRALDVRRTPTLFYLRHDGVLVGRSSGAPRPAELIALVEGHTARVPVGSPEAREGRPR